MPKLNLDPDHISDFLNEPNFESESSNIAQLLPPLPCRITLTLDEVVPYDKNPRQTRNPNYDSIKESIRNRGLEDEPTVTRRSIDEPFMIRNGGNTRLQILRELYDEYQALAGSTDNEDEAQALRLKAESFYRFEWNYKPWEGEENALIGHMVENEERGDMIYIEKALAVKQLQAFFNENEEKPLSSRKLAQKITDYGWSISKSSVALMLYTAELDDHLHNALWAGLGKGQISKLLSIHRAYTKFCTSNGLSNDQAEAIWQESLSANDETQLDISAIRRYGDNLISNALNMEFFTVAAEIDVLLGGHVPVERQQPLPPEQLSESQTVPVNPADSGELNNVVHIDRSETLSVPSSDGTAHGDDSDENTAETGSQGVKSAPKSEPVTEEMIMEMRKEVYAYVMGLALKYDLMSFISFNRYYGLGFYVEPYDRDNLSNPIINHPDHTNRNALWLYLKQLSAFQLMRSESWPIPNDMATSDSELPYDVFYTLNNHFHLMRYSDPDLQAGINTLETAIAKLLQMAREFYADEPNPVLSLFGEFIMDEEA